MAKFLKVAKLFKAPSIDFHNLVFKNKHFVFNKKNLHKFKF